MPQVIQTHCYAQTKRKSATHTHNKQSSRFTCQKRFIFLLLRNFMSKQREMVEHKSKQCKRLWTITERKGRNWTTQLYHCSTYIVIEISVEHLLTRRDFPSSIQQNKSKPNQKKLRRNGKRKQHRKIQWYLALIHRSPRFVLSACCFLALFWHLNRSTRLH